MSNILLDLELEELSLVDRPANAEAMVSLFKRDNGDIEKMTDDEKIKAYMEKEGCTRREAMKALGIKDEEMEKMEKENQELRKALIENGFEITKDGIQKKVEEDFVEFEGEKVYKSDDRFELVKRLNEVEVEKKEQEILKRAEESYPNIKTEHAVTLLKFADSEDKEFMEFLASIDAMFAKAFDENGNSSAETSLTTAREKLDAAVNSYMEENGIKKSESHKAYAEVMKTEQGRELYKAIQKGE